MMTTRLTIALITIIFFSCNQQSAKKIDASTAPNKEATLNLVNASSLLVPAVITAKQNKEIAGRPACCKSVPSRFKLNTGDLKKTTF